MTSLRVAILCILIQASTVCLAQKSAHEADVTDIKDILIRAYIKGILIERDVALVKTGFHPEFTLSVLHEGRLIKASLDMWLARLDLNGTRNTNKIDFEFKFIDVAKHSAIARIEIFENSKHIYTDYFSLYRFGDGWKIVSKIFAEHN